MHLLLLIAAAFSSSFVAPNSLVFYETTLPSGGVTEVQLLAGLPDFNVVVTGHEGLSLKFAIVNDGSASVPSKTIEITPEEGATGGTFTFKGVTAPGYVEASNFYIRIQNETNPSPVYSGAIGILAAKQWVINAGGAPAALKDTQLTALPELTLVPNAEAPAEAWPTTGLSVVFEFTRSGTKYATDPIAVTVTTPQSPVYTIATADLSKLGILSSDWPTGVTITAKLILKDTDVFHTKTVVLTITKETPEAAFASETVTEGSLALPSSFTFAASPVPTWADDSTVTAIFRLEKRLPTTTTGEVTALLTFTETQANAGTWSIKDADLYPIPVTADTKEIYVYFEETKKSGGTKSIANKPITLGYTKENPAFTGTWDLSKKEYTVDELKNLPEALKITGNTAATEIFGTLMRARFWTKVGSTETVDKEVIVKVPKTEVPEANTDYEWVIPAEFKGLAALDVEAATTVYVQLAPTGTRNYMTAPVQITVSGGAPVCEFTVSPLNIDIAVKQKETIIVKQKDQATATLWPDTINILLSRTAEADPSVITTIVPATKTGASPNFEYKITNFDLTLLTGLEDEDTIYVYVHYVDADEEDVYLETPAEIGITGDFPEPLFTIAPTEFDLKDGTTIDVVATQKAQETKWGDDVYLLFSVGPVADPTTITLKKKATYALVSTATHTWKVTGFAPKTEFTTLKKGDIIYVYVLQGFKEDPAAAGTIVAGDGRIAIKDTTPTAEFTVAPVKVDLQKATTAEVVVTKKATPAWTDDVFFHYSLTEITTQPDDDKFVKATLASATYKHTLTLSTLTGIKKGDTIYVYVKPNVPAPPAPSNAKTGVMLPVPGAIAVEKSDPAEAAMGVSPLLSLLAAALLLLVKLF